MSFFILKPEHLDWKNIFEKLPSGQKDVFYSPSFASLCQKTLYQEHEVLCAGMLSGDEVLLYPFVKRNLGKLTGISELSSKYDISSLYGRGGLVGSPAGLRNKNLFYEELSKYCYSNNIICSFDRFHPVIGNDLYADQSAHIIEVGGFVVVDLRHDLDVIEQAFKHSIRKHLRKAENNKIVCFSEINCLHVREFIDIYSHTMNRNNANQFYFFSKEYFEAVEKEISGQFHFFYAKSGSEIVSCELVLHQGIYSHSFLGGTKRDAMPLCANHLIKRQIIRTMKKLGCEYFLLGGGPQKDDGIFNFKKGYAPDGVFPSKVGGVIWDKLSYESVREKMQIEGKLILDNKFQFYDS